MSEEINRTLNRINIAINDLWTSLTSLDIVNIDNDLNPKILKYCATSLNKPIHHLFCQSITHGQSPSEWKIHRIIPIFKSGDS